MYSPVPYVPPERRPALATDRPGGPAKALMPWQKLRGGETHAQWQDRMSHTCWVCGHYESDTAELDRHEEAHPSEEQACATQTKARTVPPVASR